MVILVKYTVGVSKLLTGTVTTDQDFKVQLNKSCEKVGQAYANS